MYGPLPAVLAFSQSAPPFSSTSLVSAIEKEYIGRICRKRWFGPVRVTFTVFSSTAS